MQEEKPSDNQVNPLTNKRIPNESEEYRQKRDELLKMEYELRQQIEKVAQKRRELPEGGQLKEDYLFEEYDSNTGQIKQIKLSELFAENKNSLLVYNLMFAPKQEAPCVMCTSLIDGLDGQAQHISQRMNIVVVAKQSAKVLKEFAENRGWKNLRFLSWQKNNFGIDYFGELEPSQYNPMGQQPVATVFNKKQDGRILHFWTSEMLYSDLGPGVQPRHVDLLWPLWNVFDLIPEGRGETWYPKLKYD